MTGYKSKQKSAHEIEIAELKNSLAQAKQKKTLRDEFAMAAIGAVIQKKSVLEVNTAAEIAYCVADAMMRERMK
jgi:hypothetical protein